MAVVGIQGQTGGAAIKAASGSGTKACAAGTNAPVTISGLDFTPDLIILYGEGSGYRFSASCYTGELLPGWNNTGWGNGQACFRLATTIGDKAFTFTLYSSAAVTVSYWWRAFKLK